MPLQQAELERLLLETAGRRRFTQDSPVFADVWLGYLNQPDDYRQDLLLEPHHLASAGVLAATVRQRLGDVREQHKLAYAGDYVAVWLTLRELLAVVLPLSSWWKDLIRPEAGSVFEHLERFVMGDNLEPDPDGHVRPVPPPEDELAWWVKVAGRLLSNTSDEDVQEQNLYRDDLRPLTSRILDELDHPTDELPEVRPLWSVSRNRPVKATLWRSRETVKADAASRLFPVDTEVSPGR